MSFLYQGKKCLTLKLDLFAWMVCFSCHHHGSKLGFEGMLTWLGENTFSHQLWSLRSSKTTWVWSILNLLLADCLQIIKYSCQPPLKRSLTGKIIIIIICLFSIVLLCYQPCQQQTSCHFVCTVVFTEETCGIFNFNTIKRTETLYKDFCCLFLNAATIEWFGIKQKQ